MKWPTNQNVLRRKQVCLLCSVPRISVVSSRQTGHHPESSAIQSAKQPLAEGEFHHHRVPLRALLRRQVTKDTKEFHCDLRLCSVPVPFISSSVQGKLAIRAVMLDDADLLKSLLADVDRVCSVMLHPSMPFYWMFVSLSGAHPTWFPHESLGHPLCSEERQSRSAANLAEGFDIAEERSMSVPWSDHGSTEYRKVDPLLPSFVSILRLCSASIRTLGFRTAPLMASRGAREGNNALNKVSDRRWRQRHGLWFRIRSVSLRNTTATRSFNMPWKRTVPVKSSIYFWRLFRAS